MEDREKQFKSLVMDYKQIFLGEQGKRITDDLERHSTMNVSGVLNKNNIDVNRLIWDEAQRSLILYILYMRDVDLDVVKQKETE